MEAAAASVAGGIISGIGSAIGGKMRADADRAAAETSSMPARSKVPLTEAQKQSLERYNYQMANSPYNIQRTPNIQANPNAGIGAGSVGFSAGVQQAKQKYAALKG